MPESVYVKIVSISYDYERAYKVKHYKTPSD